MDFRRVEPARCRDLAIRIVYGDPAKKRIRIRQILVAPERLEVIVRDLAGGINKFGSSVG